MTKELFDQIVEALLPEMDDAEARKALVQSALVGSPVLQKISWAGEQRTFTIRLVRVLIDFGTLSSGKPAIVALLEEVRRQVGTDRQAEIDRVLAQLEAASPQTVTAQPTPPPEKSFAENELYVFISYAGRDRAVAEQVRDYLTAAGVRVFLDTREIRTGKDWVVTIDTALRECGRMVLLLSKSSMPYRKEVHLEWVFFDREQKPIYPLYIEDCDLLYRLRVYNYIDARTDLPGALKRLASDLKADFTPPQPITSAEKINILKGAESDITDLPTAINALRRAVLEPAGSVVLSEEQALAIKDHKPADLSEYRLGRIAEWSLPRHTLDKRFVNLTLLLDKGESEPQRWHRAEDFRFNDLRDALAQTLQDPALVLLGAPGSGKSTLLRRLQLDHSVDCLRAGDAENISYFIQLNGYRAGADGKFLEPRQWLNARWSALYPQLPALETYLQQGKALLLLDALNEMPHRSADDYHRLVGLWRAFAQDAARQGNRIVFSCRSLDYSASLSSPELRVPQIEVQPMTGDQVREFLDAYVAAQSERIWNQLNGSPQFALFQTPYFLKLLCDQVETSGNVPAGRAALFTGFVRQSLKREIHRELFELAGGLLNEADHEKLSLNRWRNAFELPERGMLFPKLSHLAFAMQQKGLETEGAQVRIDFDDACDALADAKAEALLKAGIALNVLDKDVAQYEISFFHQLLQEYFAARQLAKAPNPALVRVEWQAERVEESLAETIAKLADGDPLPPLPQTGWEETTLTAAPMVTAMTREKDSTAFIRNLIEPNLPLAARCAATPDVRISPELKRELQQRLIERTQDSRADLRARIAAGESLGLLGDPRFELRKGTYGEFLLPPLVTIPAGNYTVGDDDGEYDREKPQGEVELPEFQIGRFPVTNAEYKLFIDAGGYEQPQWWDTPESLAWRSGEASSEGAKQSWRDTRKALQDWSDEGLLDLVKQNRATTKQVEDWITVRNWSEEEFERQLEEWYPNDKLYREPEFWNDTRFNNPAQPVVGVTWFEARAYCCWLTANAADGLVYRLPTEAEFEAAARGKQGRQFPYDDDEFDSSRCNTFESHIRRTTPVGVFANATPEGAYDLSGNAYTWTTSIYDQERFPYPYRSDDGREELTATGVRRVLRGGSWFNLQLSARAVSRYDVPPADRYYSSGFRLVVLRPPS
ncbi:MAG TPA: SUMF1/EgtB/PvdO family nonheme iron enzyme, partial [Blastocatellia bacterium]|nr:SUMF1/EgtB/PvdO family nonheme iron enzyme [Blastocatellia bacterium]